MVDMSTLILQGKKLKVRESKVPAQNLEAVNTSISSVSKATVFYL